MDSGYYAACAGFKAQSQALEVLANNLANLNVNGYRGQQPTFRSLMANSRGEWLGPLNQVINNFNVLGGTRVDMSTGNFEQTGNPLDLAIEGKGFFAIQTQSGTLYTRNGNFRVSPDGKLVTGEGDIVLGDQGTITVPSGTVNVGSDGTISVNGAVSGKVRLVELVPGASLTPEGNANYSVADGAVQPATSSRVRQGTLEASNVNPVAGMVSLILVQRNAEMIQRALSTFYSEFNRIAANDLPRV